MSAGWGECVSDDQMTGWNRRPTIADPREDGAMFGKSSSSVHKGLRRPACRAAAVPKVRKIVFFLQDMEQESELRAVPAWKPPHQLTGDRKGVWSLFVTKNRRITFRIDQAEIEIIDLNYEDYH
jgi:proteic killer suppression protein